MGGGGYIESEGGAAFPTALSKQPTALSKQSTITYKSILTFGQHYMLMGNVFHSLHAYANKEYCEDLL